MSLHQIDEDQYYWVRTKRGQYRHPVRYFAAGEGHYITKRLLCQSHADGHPTKVRLCTLDEHAMPVCPRCRSAILHAMFEAEYEPDN